MHTYNLTFDDGPGPQTDDLLDLLGEHDQRATFFVLGERIDSHKPTVERIMAEGHQLAYHGWTHTPSPGFQATWEQLGRAATYPALSKLYRPPWGQLDRWGKLACLMMGWSYTQRWDVAISDWAPRSVEALVDNLVVRVRPGSIVLLHDHHEGGTVWPRVARDNLLLALDRWFVETRGVLRSVRWEETTVR